MKHENAKKALAFVICVLFISAALFSAAFVLAHSRHEHGRGVPDENCDICINLAVSVSLLKLIAGALVCAALGSYRFSVIRSVIKAACLRAVSLTLVHQKIKLNI